MSSYIPKGRQFNLAVFGIHVVEKTYKIGADGELQVERTEEVDPRFVRVRSDGSRFILCGELEVDLAEPKFEVST